MAYMFFCDLGTPPSKPNPRSKKAAEPAPADRFGHVLSIPLLSNKLFRALPANVRKVVVDAQTDVFSRKQGKKMWDTRWELINKFFY